MTAFGDLSAAQGYELIELQAAAGSAGMIESLIRRAQARIADRSGPWQRAKRVFERLGGVSLSIAGTGGGFSIHEPAAAGERAASPEDLAAALAQLAAEVRSDRPHGACS